MAKVTLYTNPQSRGRIARWMLEEVGEPYDTVVVSYGEEMKAPTYLAINPMGKVPAITHDGAVVTEVAAICAYLADTFPAAGLGPREAERASYYRWLFYGAGPLEAAGMAKAFGLEPAEDRSAQLGYGTVDRAFETLNAHLAAHDFAAGDRFTAADVYLGAQLMWGMMFGTMPREPAFEAYVARTTDRDAFRRANEIDEALLAEAANQG